MNCFYHPTVVSVGFCKSCNKGLCPQCAVDLGKGLACKGRCEEEVKELISLVARTMQRSSYNEKMVKAARSHNYFGEAFTLILGLIFLGYAAFNYFQCGFDAVDIFLGGIGLSFLIFGLVGLQRTMRFPLPPK